MKRPDLALFRARHPGGDATAAAVGTEPQEGVSSSKPTRGTRQKFHKVPEAVAKARVSLEALFRKACEDQPDRPALLAAQRGDSFCRRMCDFVLHGELPQEIGYAEAQSLVLSSTRFTVRDGLLYRTAVHPATGGYLQLVIP